MIAVSVSLMGIWLILDSQESVSSALTLIFGLLALAAGVLTYMRSE